MKIDISDDTMYNIVIDVLKHDYKQLGVDIERFQDKAILSDIEQEDLDNWKRHLSALETTLEYYAGLHWNR